MERRKFLLNSAALISSGALIGLSKNVVAQSQGIDVVSEVKRLRIPTGPYAGAYQIAPNGKFNWYFTNLGLLPIIQNLNASDLSTYILNYLNLYLRCLDGQYTVKDVDFPYGSQRTDIFTLVPSDSDDSYAATILSLMARYLRASQNWAWWDANKTKFKEVAYRNLAVMQKSTGLVSTFQPPRSAQNSLGYLMDNAEVYRGLRDFASILRTRGEPIEANYYDLVASGVASGINSRLFDAARNGFKTSDGDRQATTAFYAGTTCQVFPQAFGVSEVSPYFDRAWSYLNRYTPNWQDGRYDPYPWAVLGFVASQRGQTAQAQAQQRSIESKFVSNRALITINELGFYQRTKNVLAGRADV